MARSGDLSRGLVAGVTAGLAASFVMTEFQKFWRHADANLRQRQAKREPATVKVADAASEALSGEPVPAPARKEASELVHYLTGAAIGAAYGALAEFLPGVTSGFGSAYGGAVWAVLDEGITPALGFAPPPQDSDAKDHLFSFSSHLIFGWALELTRGVIAEVL